MSSSDVMRLRLDAPGFAEQLQVQCAKVATDILVEAPATPLHANRLDWARKTLANPSSGADLVIWAVVSSAAITANAGDPSKIADLDVEAAIVACLDGFLAPIEPLASKPLPRVSG